MSSETIRNGLIAVLSIEIVIVILCIIIAVAAFVYFRRHRNKTPALRPWPYVLPLYFYLSYYDGVVDKLFTTEPRLKMFQGSKEPPDKVRPLVELFIELEKEIEVLYRSKTGKNESATEVGFVYPEKVPQLYDLEEMIVHYKELKELYSVLEGDNAGEDENKHELTSRHGTMRDSDTENVRTMTKGAILLETIKVHLETFLESTDDVQPQKCSELTTIENISETTNSERLQHNQHRTHHRVLLKERNIFMNRSRPKFGANLKHVKQHKTNSNLISGNRNVKNFLRTGKVEIPEIKTISTKTTDKSHRTGSGKIKQFRKRNPKMTSKLTVQKMGKIRS